MHYPLYLLFTEEGTLRKGTHHVVVDKLVNLPLLRVLLQTWVLYVGIHHHMVLLAFTLQGLLLVVLVGRHVLQ
jgi:hypothetical protein